MNELSPINDVISSYIFILFIELLLLLIGIILLIIVIFSLSGTFKSIFIGVEFEKEEIDLELNIIVLPLGKFL